MMLIMTENGCKEKDGVKESKNGQMGIYDFKLS